MHLNRLLGCSVHDAGIAVRLMPTHASETISVLTEAAVQVANFNYSKAKNDPRPQVMVFGKWRHPKTGNELVCGVNLNYLDSDQKSRLDKALPEILAQDSLKSKYWIAMSMAPDIMKTAYRTYDEKFIVGFSGKNVEVGEPSVPEPKQQKTAPLPPPPDEDKKIEPVVPKDKLVPPMVEPAKKVRLPEKPDKPPETPTEPLDVPVQPKDPETKQKQPKAADGPKEPTKKPEPKGFRAKLTQGLSNLISKVKNRLFKNKKTPTIKPEASKPSDQTVEKELNKVKNIESRAKVVNEPIPKTPEQEISKLDKLEDSQKAASEVEKLKELEDKEKNLPESLDSRLNAILESYKTPLATKWKSPEHYITTHSPSNFFGYDPELNGMVLDYANGSKLIAIYNIVEDKIVLDLSDSQSQMLAETGWDLEDTVRIMIEDNGIKVDFEHPNGVEICEEILNSPFGALLRGVCLQD